MLFRIPILTLNNLEISFDAAKPKSNMMPIYFFSSHRADPKMVEDLGQSITTRFAGNISDIHRQDKQIAFIESLHIGGERIKICHTIPAESTVVVEAPILKQSDWLNAGVNTLLVPQMRQEAGTWGSVVFKYCGLIQVHKIEVTTSPWSNRDVAEDQPENILIQSAPTNPLRQQAPNLFTRLRKNPFQHTVS